MQLEELRGRLRRLVWWIRGQLSSHILPASESTPPTPCRPHSRKTKPSLSEALTIQPPTYVSLLQPLTIPAAPQRRSPIRSHQ